VLRRLASACKRSIWHVPVILHLVQEQVHNWRMRTNVNIAMIYAQANGLTLGDAITDLIRKGGKAASEPAGSFEFERSAAGFPIFPLSGRVITTEMVKKALEDFI
jgi:hypothetical protein